MPVTRTLEIISVLAHRTSIVCRVGVALLSRDPQVLERLVLPPGTRKQETQIARRIDVASISCPPVPALGLAVVA